MVLVENLDKTRRQNQSLAETNKVLKARVKDMETMNNMLVGKIETLEEENKKNQDEVARLSIELTDAGRVQNFI